MSFEKVPLIAPASATATSIISIEGMTCGACVASIEEGIESIDGVLKASVSLVTERGSIEYDTTKTSPEEIIERVESCGFEAHLLNTKEHAPLPLTQSQRAFATFAIEGMTCGSCVSAVTSGLQELPGVSNVAISLVTERGAVEYDLSLVSLDQILERIDECGFFSKLISSRYDDPKVAGNLEDGNIQELRLKVHGMTSSNCTSSIEHTLLSTMGVKRASVVLASEEAIISYDSTVTGPRTIVEAVENAGFDAILATSADNSLQLESLSRVKSIARNKRELIICLIFALPVIIISKFVPGALPFLAFLKTPIFRGLYIDDVVNFTLILPIQFGVGLKFYTKSYSALARRAPTMDVLVCVSTSCAFFFSIFSVIYAICTGYSKHPATLWGTSAMIITFITGGRYLENKAKGQTSVALSRLISLSPSTATIYTNPEKYRENLNSTEFDSTALEHKTISADLLQPGDIVVLLPGDKVSADGTVLSGESYVDEALITGESMPVTKKPGDTVICGSINGHGHMDVEVSRTGNDTKLALIVQLVQDAQVSKTQVQRYADYIAGIFVPVILLLALSTFVVWMILSHALNNPPKVFEGEQGKFMVCLHLCISVIVVACPCALGLATPTAVMVGTGVGASNGILIKGGAVLETASRVTTVLFDKTGTLTTGKMAVSEFQFLSRLGSTPIKTTSWWTLIAAVEQQSEHPVARGIVAKARIECGMENESTQISADPTDSPFDALVTDFKVVVGRGVTATVTLPLENSATYSVVAGNSKLLSSLKIDIPSDVLQKSMVAGQTVVFVAINNMYAGYIALSDTIRPQARVTVEALKRLGFAVGIVSGDQLSVVQRVAEEVGIPQSYVWGGMSPQNKLEIIQALEAKELESSTYSSIDPEGSPEVVAFVGDGINDSPALAQASLGISLAGATDAAMEAAGIVLIKEDPLLDVAAAFHLSRATFTRIKLNLGWAVFYNMIMIPFAMGFFLPVGVMMKPVFAGAAMMFSSISVIVSSLLLQLWRRPSWMSQLEPVSLASVRNTPNLEATGIRGWLAYLKKLVTRTESTPPSYQRLDNN